MKTLRSSSFIIGTSVATAFAVALMLSGCGGSSHSSSTTTTSPTSTQPSSAPPATGTTTGSSGSSTGSTGTSGSGSTGSGGSTSGSGSGNSGSGSGSGSGGSGSGSGGSASSISGKVVDGVTGAPIPTPAVVALEKMGGDFQLVQQVAVAADGSFKFDNVASGPNYALVFNAQDNAGGFYTPLVLAGGGPFNGQLITPGTNVGTIKLAHNGPPTAGSIHTQEAASTASNTPATITIKIDLRTFVEDFEFSLPMIGGMPTTTTQTSSCSDPSTACSQVTLDVPTDPAQFEEFGTNQPPTTPTPEEDYLIRAFAFVPGTNEPDCSPSEQDGFLPGMNRGDNLSVVIPTFKGCK